MLVAYGSVLWLLMVGLYQHEAPCTGNRISGCPTVYGYDAPVPDGNPVGLLILLGGFSLPAVLLGRRRSVPPLVIGASLAFGPVVLAPWTAPRGYAENQSFWWIVFWYLPVLGAVAALVAAGTGAVRGRASRPV